MSASLIHAARRELQKQQARSLYRRSLKTVLSWAIHKELFYEEADKLRDSFEGNKNEADVDRIDRLLAAGEAELLRNIHPDPYIVPWCVGGSKWERNPPVPPEIAVVHDFGKQED